MLNTKLNTNVNYYGGNTNNTLKINACSGGIYKTYRESWFERFNLKSQRSDCLFNNCAISEVRTGIFEKKFGHHFGIDGNYDDFEYNYDEPRKEKKKLIILQMVICGDMEVIAELIKKEDFDKYFENKVEDTNNEV